MKKENNKRRAHTSTWLKKKYWGLHCFYNVHDYQHLSLSLSWNLLGSKDLGFMYLEF